MAPDEIAEFKTAKSETVAEGVSTPTFKAAMADYDRIRPLMDGRVRPDGFDLDITTDDIRQFCIRPVYEEFDIAEMSMSWYVATKARGEPCVALPIFPLRMAVLGYLYCHADAPYSHPSELKGKRIGSPAFRYTVNLWLRGMLKEHYGLAPEDMSWVTNEEETNSYAVPDNVDVTILPDRSLGQALIDGEIDAIMAPEPPQEFKDRHPGIRRLFTDARAEQAEYFTKTGIYPITHTMVVHEKLARDKPWLAPRLVETFRAAQRECDSYYADYPKRLSLPGAAFLLEEERRDYGDEPWSHGIEGNRDTVETFVRYARDQGYLDRIIPIEEFFAAGTLDV